MEVLVETEGEDTDEEEDSMHRVSENDENSGSIQDI